MTKALRKPGRPVDPDLGPRRQGEILAVAAAVFARAGYAAADVQAIADQVGVGKGTIYRYFPTKKALFLAAVDQGLDELSVAIDAVILDETIPPLDRFAGVVRAYLGFFAARPEMAELFVQERATFRDRHLPRYFALHDSDTCEPTDQFAAQLIAAGVLRPLQLDHLRDVVGDLLYGTVMANTLSGRRVSPDRQAAEILDIVFHGILSDPERRRMTPSAPEPAAKPARRKPVAALLLAAGLLGLPACAPPEAAPTDKAVPAATPAVTVTTGTVEERSVQRAVTAVGTLTGFDEVAVSPKVDGRVLKVLRDVGDHVYPGEVILELDPVDLQLDVDSARRALESDLARVGLTELPRELPGAAKGAGFDPEAVAAVARATLVMDNARVEHKRVTGLASSSSISRREADIAELDLRTAEVAKRDAVTQAYAALAQARLRQSQLEIAEQRLKDTVMTAPVPQAFGVWAAALGTANPPISYAVSSRMVSEGEVLRSTPVTTVFKLVLDTALKMRATVPESYAPQVKVGQTVQLQVDAYPGREFTGVVARINPTIDPLTRAFNVEVSVANLDRRLKAGGFARARILTRTETVRTIPPAALVTFAGVTKVFTVAGGHAKAVEVRLGNREQGYLEVTSPLPPGTTVCTSGFSQLIEDSPVTVRN